MILTFIGIQTACVVAATSYVISHIRPKKLKLKVSSSSNGFKHYKTF
jgi:hypothetical protein